MSRHTTRLLSRLFRPAQWSDAAYIWAAAAVGVAAVVLVALVLSGVFSLVVFAIRLITS